MNLSEKSYQFIWHPYTQMQTSALPVAIVRGEGAYIYDDQGKSYIDAISSWWVNLHGHSNPYIAEKVSEQLKVLEHVIFAGFTHEPAVSFAEKLLSILPGNQSKIFFSDNGSTAVEVALKMMIQFWRNNGKKKNKIIAFENSYHGDTFGSMSVSSRSSFTDHFSDFLFDVIHIPYPEKGMEQKTVELLKQQILNFPNEIAGFIFEPLILGAGGMLMYEAEAADELITICRDNSILCAADEVMTGFGRTGRNFASDYLTFKPDIICLSKGITGGTMPLGATTCTSEIFDSFLSDSNSKTFFHGHSYTANPLACIAAIASLELLLKDECQTSIQEISELHKKFADKNRHSKFLKNIRYAGTILAMEVSNNEPDTYFNSLRDKLYNHFLENGLLLRPLGNTIYVMPPYCISIEQLNKVYSVIESLENILSV